MREQTPPGGLPELAGHLPLHSGQLLISDPSFLHGGRILALGKSLILPFPAGQAGVYVTYTEWRVASIIITTPDVTIEDAVTHATRRRAGRIHVDTGLLLIMDQNLARSFQSNEPMLDPRVYEGPGGKILRYGRDFARFNTPIPSEDGQDMNTLLATPHWKQVPVDLDALPFGQNLVALELSERRENLRIIREQALSLRPGWGDGMYAADWIHAPSGMLSGVSITFIPPEHN